MDETTFPEEIVPFNFSRAGMVTYDQTRTLRNLDEQFARNLTHTLGAWLRTTIVVTPMPPDQESYGQFADKTSEGHYLLPLVIEPVQVRAALSSDLSLAPAMIDLLLGGSGRSASFQRELTEIEEAVLAAVLDIVLREWSAAWQPFGMEFLARPRERGGHGQRSMQLQERTYCSCFQVALAGVSGELRFCMPSAALASALRRFTHRRDHQRNRTAEEQLRMTHRLRSAKIQASLQFPMMQLRAEDLREMEKGMLFPLPLAPGISGKLLVGNTPIFRAEPMQSGDHRAAQIAHPLNGLDAKEKVA